MKTIIAGSRGIRDRDLVVAAVVEAGWLDDTTVFVSGDCANSPDEVADYLSQLLRRGVKFFRPNWTLHGRAAGPIRNAEMADYGDRLVLVWDGKSKGSASMKREMLKRGKPVFEKIVEM